MTGLAAYERPGGHRAGTRGPLLQSKLLPPRLPSAVVPRSSLLEDLRSGRESTLTVVCAPPGYGKTTTLAQWMKVDAGEAAFAWVSLDQADADPARFWTYVISALAQVEPSVGNRSLVALRQHATELITDVLPLLLEELSGGAQDAVLVLDDYHLVESDPVAESMAFFLQHSPDRIQVAIAARSDPRLPLARLRASGSLAELRAENLRFTSTEVKAFFERAAVAPLSAVDVDNLAKRTDGWPAVLRLAAILLRPQHDVSRFVRTFAGSNRQVVDYMATDVLQTLPPPTRTFVLRTSILRRLCGSLCDAVAGVQGSAATLRELSRVNVFITQLEGDGGWYRYHQLLAEALRTELQDNYPGLIAQLHTRASNWFEATGDLESATDHAITARDIGLSSRLILRQLQPFVATGRVATIDRWLAELSWPQARSDPELAVARAVAAGLTSQLEQAESWLEVAAEGPRNAMTGAGVPLGFGVDFLRSFFALRDISSTYEVAQRAVSQAPAPEWRGAALTGLGQCLYLLGQSAEAIDPLREAMSLLPDDPYMVCLAAGYLALAECDRENAERGERLARRTVSLLDARSLAHAGTAGLCHLSLGAALKAQGHLAEAETELSFTVRLHHADSPSLWHAHALVRLADVRWASGNHSRAMGALEEAEAILERLPDAGIVPQLAGNIRRRLSTPSRRPVAFGQQLSERELAVLRLLVAELTLREIAGELHVSYNTVKSHTRTIYRKLGAESRFAAIERAKKHGLL